MALRLFESHYPATYHSKYATCNCYSKTATLIKSRLTATATLSCHPNKPATQNAERKKKLRA